MTTGPVEFSDWEPVEHCPVCGAPDADRPLRRFPSQSRCCACGHVYLSPRPTQAAIAESYGRPDAYEQWLVDEDTRATMWAKRIRKVDRYTTGGRALDVGAGPGAFLHGLIETGRWEVDGTEISRQAVEIASSRYGIELRHGALGEVELAAGGYDLITLWHVLEHVPDVRATLADAVGALKPHGVLVIAVPNDSTSVRVPLVKARDAVRRSGQSGLELMMGPPVPGAEIHLQHFSRRSLIRALRRTGLNVLHVGVDDHYPKPTRKTDMKVGVGATVHRLTRLNLFPTMLVVAENRAGGVRGASG